MSFKVKSNISKKLESNFPTFYEHFRDGKRRGGSKYWILRFSLSSVLVIDGTHGISIRYTSLKEVKEV